MMPVEDGDCEDRGEVASPALGATIEAPASGGSGPVIPYRNGPPNSEGEAAHTMIPICDERVESKTLVVAEPSPNREASEAYIQDGMEAAEPDQGYHRQWVGTTEDLGAGPASNREPNRSRTNRWSRAPRETEGSDAERAS